MSDVQQPAVNTSKLLAYFQLVRFPAVFTAMADIFLGYLIVHRSFEPVFDFVFLLLASSCLYLSGMVFNDVFDRRIDAQERPGRPIPSGRISLSAAIGLGALLMAAGVERRTVVGQQSGLIALLIVVAIFAYDWLLKSTPLSPVAMGSCRFLNVILMAVPRKIYGRDITSALRWRWGYISLA